MCQNEEWNQFFFNGSQIYGTKVEFRKIATKNFSNRFESINCLHLSALQTQETLLSHLQFQQHMTTSEKQIGKTKCSTTLTPTTIFEN